jgi:transposase-like protein
MQRESDNGTTSNTASKRVPEIEVEPRPKRRTFTAEYKLRILQETDQARDDGKIGEILRREGLYSSHLTTWRRDRDEGARAALKKKRGRKSTRNPLADEVERLKRENGRLLRKLQQAEVIIDVQKKVAGLLGLPLSSPPYDESGS